MNLRRLVLLAVLAATTASARPAAAWGGCGNGGWGYSWGYWGVGDMYRVLADNVPYFSAFPPVYYSYPVPRTYGYSPFAYPPGVMTPEVVMAEPLSINNPFFKGEPESETADATPAAPADRTTSTAPAVKPLVVHNPFVVDAAYASR